MQQTMLFNHNYNLFYFNYILLITTIIIIVIIYVIFFTFNFSTEGAMHPYAPL